MRVIRGSLRGKLIVFLLFAIVIPISISILVTYQYTKETVKTSSIQDNTTLLYQGATNMQNYLNRINQTSLLLYQDIRNEKSLYRLIERSELDFADEQDLYVSLQYMVNSLAEAKQIHIYMDKSSTSYRFAYNLRRSAPGATYIPDFGADRDVYMQPAHLSHTYGVNKFTFEQQEQVITIHRKILNQPTDEVLGTLSIDIKLDIIREISRMLYAEEAEELYLIDHSGGMIYASEQLDGGSVPWLDEILAADAEFGDLEYRDAVFDGIHLYRDITTPFAEWTLVKRIPYEHLYQNARQLTLINSLIVTFFLIIAVIAILYISFHFTLPIKRLIQTINRIESGQLDAKPDTYRADEIGILSRRFHQMMERLDQLINKEYKLEIANKTNQLKALQAQVNPHFMNNALQSIGTLALQNKEKKIYSLIASLGKMMRYQMNTNETLVPLSAEIDYVKAYLDLQAQRFDEKLQFHLDIEEETRWIKVPRMTVQPLVENCFKHGFVKQNNIGEIWIAARRMDANQLLISVADNGAGMEPEELDEIQARLDLPHAWEEGTGAGSIGLFNVQSRLLLYFDGYARIGLEARDPQGLKVNIMIMLEEGALNEDEGSDRG